MHVLLLFILLTNGDSVATDSMKHYEIPEVIEPFGETNPVGNMTAGYSEHTTLDILKNLPVVPLSYGYGIWSTVMNKGRAPSYTRVSVNGHLINTYPFGYVSLGLLPLHAFDRVLFGQHAGGAEFSSINFVSKINRYDRPYSFVHFTFGSFESNTYGFDLTRGITDKLGFYLSGAHYETGGHRENSDVRTLSAYSNIYMNYWLPVRLDVFYVNSDYGFPGSIQLPVEGRQKEEFLDISGTTKWGNEIFTLFYERRIVDYRDTVYDKTWGVQVDHVGARSEGSDTLLDFVLDYGASAFVTMIAGELFLPEISNGFDVWARLERSFGRGFARAAGKFGRSSYHDNNIFMLPRIELGMKVLGAAVYAALSRDTRGPTDMEQWAPYDTLNPYLLIAGNSLLEPEYCWCGEIGLRSDAFMLNAYRVTFSNNITVFQEFPGFYQYGNLDTWEMQGIEAYANFPLRAYSSDSSKMTEFALGLAGNVTVSQDSLRRFPRYFTGAFLALRRETPRFGFGVRLRAEYSSETYDIFGAEYAGYTVFSVAGLVKFMALSCVLRLNNVFDEDYAYVSFYPMAPRNFDVSVKWEFLD